MGSLRIRLKLDGSLLVDAAQDQIQMLEGNIYVHPDSIVTQSFDISDREYNCPAKGTSYWVDLKTEQGWLNDICWIYPHPLPAYSHIAGWYGFYPEHKRYEVET